MSSTRTRRSGSSKALAPFLQHVVDILEEADDSVACWSADGQSFSVSDVKSFSRLHLASHFKSSQFSSFVRQLNFYGFHKVAQDGKKHWTFRHDLFIRGRPDLMQNIKRKTSAEYHTAHKGEVAELRQRLGHLEGDLQRASQHINALGQLLQRTVGAEALASMSVPESVAAALAAAGLEAKTSPDGSWSTAPASTTVTQIAGGEPKLSLAFVPGVAQTTGAAAVARRAVGASGDIDLDSDAEDSATAQRVRLAKERAEDRSSKQAVKRRRKNRPGSGEIAFSPKMSDDDVANNSEDAGLELSEDDLDALAEAMVASDDELMVSSPVAPPVGAHPVPQSLSVTAKVGSDAPDAMVSPMTRLGDIESISQAFNASLDFTGAGKSFLGGFGDSGSFSWADSRQPLRISRPQDSGPPSGTTPVAWATPSGGGAPDPAFGLSSPAAQSVPLGSFPAMTQ